MIESLVLLSSLLQIRKIRMDASTSGRIAQVPVSHAEIINFLIKNPSKLQKRRFYGEDNPLEMTKQRPRVTGTTMLVVCDNESEKKYKYSVSINHQRKRVTVCFQHSGLNYGHVEVFAARLAEVVNPALCIGSSRNARVAVNENLLSILEPSFGESKNQPGTHVWSEFQKIVDTQLRPILDQNCGYKVYATGYNNGAALATLFAFYAAAQPDETLSKPVSLITFGSPYVGDQAFREAHQSMEAMGKLRHLRISNHLDYTPLTPQMSLHFNVFSFRAFKHVGIHLKLHDELLPPEISSAPRADEGLFVSAIDELHQAWGQSIFANMPLNPLEWPEVGLKDYVDRLLANKPLLEGIQLNKLYAREGICCETFR
jgi:Lipase (class 3)